MRFHLKNFEKRSVNLIIRLEDAIKSHQLLSTPVKRSRGSSEL